VGLAGEGMQPRAEELEQRGDGRHRLFRRPGLLARSAVAAIVAVMALSASRGLDALALRLQKPDESSEQSAGEEADVKVEIEVPETPVLPEVEYVIGNVWESSHQRRALELDAENLSVGAEGDSSRVRRLVVPMRLQDVHFLRLISPEHLRVDLWPHRTMEPHLHVRVLTDAVSFYPRRPEPRRGLISRLFASDGTQWLTLMQAVVHMPHGTALMSCHSAWRWADFNETELSWREAIAPPFRVLEISCPRRPKGFLLQSPIVVSPSGPNGRMASRDILVSCFRAAFVAMLIIVCVAQVVLLMVCITMLIVQMGLQRRRGQD